VDAREQYECRVAETEALVARGPDVITDLLAHSNYEWAAQNCRITAEAYVDLGLLHWRRGIDPREDFECAERAYLKLTEIVRQHRLPASGFETPLIYAAMFLIDRRVPIVFGDEGACRTSRWSCYQARLVHALHDAQPSELLVATTERFLAEPEKLPDRIFESYFQLLGLRPRTMSVDEHVRRAKSIWAERKRDELIPRGRALDGHGDANDLYVDLYLGAVLKKIGWKGHTVHLWRWD
jgi:hypothetical protein